eukprot:4397637-Alexandrium_andersonii.AAC.1
MYARCKISAKDLCTVAHWASRAGACGNVGRYGMAPGQGSDGDYQKHLDRKLEILEAPDTYLLRAPTLARRTLGRHARNIAF